MNPPNLLFALENTDVSSTRQKLLIAGAEVFSERGYHAATTREICDKAQSNLAAIHYHFGDKQGLYAEVLKLPLLMFEQLAQVFEEQKGSFELRMSFLYRGLLEPAFVHEQIFRQQLRLYLREMLDPTEVGQRLFSATCGSLTSHVQTVLREELGESISAQDLFMLSVSLIAMAMDLNNNKDWLSKVHNDQSFPGLDDWVSRFTRNAVALVEYEKTKPTRKDGFAS